MNKILFLFLTLLSMVAGAANLPVVDTIAELRSRGATAPNEMVLVINGETFSSPPSNTVVFISDPTSSAATNTTDVLARVGPGRWIARRIATSLLAPTKAEAETNRSYGLTLQSGPGSDNSVLLWTYPYGTKMTVFNGPNRAWELMNTLYPTGSLAFRIFAVTNWSNWKVLLDNSSTQLTAAAKYVVRVDSGTDSTRHRLNLIRGTNVTMTLVDSSGSDESQVTVSVPNLPFANLTGLPGTAAEHGITNVLLLSGGTLTGPVIGTTITVTNGIVVTIPAREETTIAPMGITMQESDLSWTYPYSTKLSVRPGLLNRGWELSNTDRDWSSPTGGMAFRYRTDIGWSPWLRFVDSRNITNYSGGGVGWDSDYLNDHDGSWYLNRSNHTGLQSYTTITGLGTGALLYTPVSGDALATNLMLGSDTRNTNARTPLAHTHPVSDLSDSGAFGRSLAQTAVLTNALNLLGSSWSSNASLVLNAAGQWTTVPASGAATNGILEAPTNGIAYARKNASWVGLDIADVAGITTFARTFITTATNFSSTNISDSSAVGRAVLTNTTTALQRTALGLGTVATYNVPASGDALATNAVIGTDTRLTNSRVPLAHGHVIADVTNLQTTLDGKLNLTGGTLTGNLIGTAAKFTNGIDTLSNNRTNTELVLPTGLSTYSGPGSDNGVNWQYPYGTKLAVYHGNNRSWELMNTTYPDGSMAFRLHDLTNWSPWKVLLDNETGTRIETFADHTNLTAGAHGMSTQGASLVAATTPTSAKLILQVPTNRVVVQNIMDSTAITLSNSLNTTYFFTGGQEDSSAHTFVVPTNDALPGTTLSIVVVGTNVHNYLPLQYYFVYSGVTNRLFDSNRLDLVYTGSQWLKKPTADFSGVTDNQVYGWQLGAPIPLGIQNDATGDNTPWVRYNGNWHRLVAGANVTIALDGSSQIAVSSTGGGGGGPTNGSNVSVDGAYIAAPNFTDSAEIDIAASGSNVTASLRDGTVGVSRLSSAALTYLVNRTNHIGTQPWSSLSDASTNVWLRALTIFQRGNGVDFATNTGANTLTISGNYLPGANVTFTTNSGTKEITINAASGGGGSSNGTFVTVNGVSPATANFTNGPDITPQLSGSNITMTLVSTAVTNGTYTNATITVDAKGRVTYAANGTASSGGGGSVYVNGDTANPVTNLVNGTSGTFQRTAGTATFVVTNVTDASIPAGIARDTEVASTYVSLGGNNTITGGNVFSGVVQFLGSLSASNVVATNLMVGSTNVAVKLAALDSAVATKAGTNIFVNNVLMQPAKLTNSATVTWTTNSNGDIVATAAGGGGGSGTNIFVNNALIQPAKLTNSLTLTWTTNANGDIVGNVTNTAGTLTTGVWQTVAGASFVATNNAGSINVINITYAGAATNLQTTGSADPATAVFFSMDFVPVRSNTNYLVFADFESSEGDGSAALFVDDAAGRRTNGVTFGIVATTGSVNFNQSGKRIRVWVVDPNVTTGGSGGSIAFDGNAVTNVLSSAGITNVISGGTATPTLTDTGVAAGTYGVNTEITFDAKGRATAARNAWIFYREYEFLTPSASRINAMFPELAAQAVNSGSLNTTIAGGPLTNHPGVMRVTAGTTANGGYGFATDVSALALAGGEYAECTFRFVNTNFTRLTFGFSDQPAVVTPTDGIVLRTATTLGDWDKFGGYVYNNGLVSSTATTATVQTNVWYIGTISNTIPSGTVTFQLLSETRSLIWSDVVTNGFPTGAGREFGYGWLAVSTNNVAINIFDIDKAIYGVRQ